MDHELALAAAAVVDGHARAERLAELALERGERAFRDDRFQYVDLIEVGNVTPRAVPNPG